MPGKLRILCVGKLSETFLREGCREYEKRLSRYLDLSIEEIRDRPDSIPEARALEEEGQEILRRLRPEEELIALAVEGKSLDSVAFSGFLSRRLDAGRKVTLAIGGSRGLSRTVLDKAAERLSFSAMTFPHGLMRLVLLEQVYRAMRIASGENYHK